MIMHVTESIWLDDAGVCSIEQMVEVSGLSAEEIDDLIRNGVIAPVDDKAQPPMFRLHYLVTARTARRLRDDFELDRHGMTLALTLLRQIDRLQAELNAARARLRQTDQRPSAPVSHPPPNARNSAT